MKGLWRRVKESIIQVQSAVSVVAFVGSSQGLEIFGNYSLQICRLAASTASVTATQPPP